MTYVIKSVFTFPSKKNPNEMVNMVSYFKSHNNYVLSFNSMTSKVDEAKHYEFHTEAMRDKRKYFGNKKGVTVVNADKL